MSKYLIVGGVAGGASAAAGLRGVQGPGPAPAPFTWTIQADADHPATLDLPVIGTGGTALLTGQVAASSRH